MTLGILMSVMWNLATNLSLILEGIWNRNRQLVNQTLNHPTNLSFWKQGKTFMIHGTFVNNWMVSTTSNNKHCSLQVAVLWIPEMLCEFWPGQIFWGDFQFWLRCDFLNSLTCRNVNHLNPRIEYEETRHIKRCFRLDMVSCDLSQCICQRFYIAYSAVCEGLFQLQAWTNLDSTDQPFNHNQTSLKVWAAQSGQQSHPTRAKTALRVWKLCWLLLLFRCCLDCEFMYRACIPAEGVKHWKNFSHSTCLNHVQRYAPIHP